MSKEPKVVLEVTMTPEEYIAIKNDATWDGKTVADYLVALATGKTRRGC